MVSLKFTEDEIMWVASNLCGAAVTLGAEAIDLINCLLCFGCALEELRFFVSSLADLMSNSSSPRSAYQALMACCIVVLEERPGVRPMGIGETLFWYLARIVMRAAGDQEKTACGNLQLFAGLKAGIEGATHAVGQRRLERERGRQHEEEAEEFE